MLLETKHGLGRTYFYEAPMPSKNRTTELFSDHVSHAEGKIKVRKVLPKSRFLQATKAKYLATNDEAYRFKQQALMEGRQSTLPGLLQLKLGSVLRQQASSQL